MVLQAPRGGFFEVDLPDVIAAKTAKIRASPQLQVQPSGLDCLICVLDCLTLTVLCNGLDCLA